MLGTLPPQREFSAITVIGVEIDSPFKFVQKRGCEHKIDETKNFCPDCGKPIYELAVDKALNEFDEKSSRIADIPVLHLRGTDRWFCGAVTKVNSISPNYKSSIGKLSVTRSDGRKEPFEDIEGFKRVLQPILEPLGLWAEKSFGVWTLLEFVSNN